MSSRQCSVAAMYRCEKGNDPGTRAGLTQPLKYSVWGFSAELFAMAERHVAVNCCSAVDKQLQPLQLQGISADAFRQHKTALCLLQSLVMAFPEGRS